MKIRGLRWWIIILVFVAAVINYVDRQTLSALAPSIQKDLAMDDHGYANVVNLFLIAYTISYLVSGRMVDRLGTRSSMTIFVLWWSLANTLTAFVQGPRSLGLCRFMLGLGEAGIWPAASKIVSKWFPSSERALAVGFYTLGATIGAMLVPQLIIPFSAIDFAGISPRMHIIPELVSGWRAAFFLCGILGILWVIPWQFLAKRPSENRWLTDKEASIIPITAQPTDHAQDTPWTWGKILTFRPLWLFLIARLLSDPVWYFYQFWFAKFLHTTHQIPQNDLTITWVLYAAAGVGSLTSGWYSGYLISKGENAARARLKIMLLCCCAMPLSPFIATVTSVPTVIIIAGCVVFSAVAWLTNITTLIVDTVPKHSLGTVFSVVAAGSALGSMGMNLVIAHMITSGSVPGFLPDLVMKMQSHSYFPWFVIMTFLHPLSWLVLKWGGISRYSSSDLQS